MECNPDGNEYASADQMLHSLSPTNTWRKLLKAMPTNWTLTFGTTRSSGCCAPQGPMFNSTKNFFGELDAATGARAENSEGKRCKQGAERKECNPDGVIAFRQLVDEQRDAL